jgi:hypothetical protein
MARVDRLYHVTASVNRQSIQEHGLDWTRMGATSGIAGSMAPEQEGIFLARDKEEAAWFAAFQRVKPVDVWEVDMTGLEHPHEEVDGFLLYKGRIARERLELVDVRIPTGDETRSLPDAEWDKAPSRHESFFQKLSKAERRRLSGS